jgi:type 2 lantibiotic biosynthesis protein LanM
MFFKIVYQKEIMFKFNLDECVDISSIEADYFYAIYQINEFIDIELSKRILKLEFCIESKIDFKTSILNQTILFLKDNFLSFVLVHEYEIAKKGSVLVGITEEDIFKDFILLTASQEWLEYFFEKYPIIQLRIEKFVNQAIDYFDYFFTKIVNDYSRFDLHFGIKGKIRDVKLFLGDLHNGNKHVFRIDFLTNASLFFKPRNFLNESFLGKVVDFYNQLDTVDFILPKSLSTNDYCWVSQLEYKNNFLTNQEIDEFYINQGKLLFIFHLLGTVDIIPDNLIISNNKPGYFDLECLIARPKYLVKESVIYMFEESVMKIGMLPDWMMNNNFERDVLSSTFFELNNQRIKSKAWKKKESNFEYVDSFESFSREEDKHLPKINNKYIELNEDLLKNVLNGFTSFYNLTIKNKALLKDFFLENSNFSNHKFRILFHPTSIYSLLYREINIPENLQNSTVIDSVIETLVGITKTDNYFVEDKVLIQSIKNQIYNLDIPYYWTDSNGILYDGNNEIITNDWEFNPMEFIIDRLEILNNSNLKFQLEIIQKSCNFALEMKGLYTGKGSFLNAEDNILFNEINSNKIDAVKLKLLNSAIKIGDTLNNTLFEIDNKINWISKVRDPADGRYGVLPLNYDLYDGQSGVGLFYLYLYKYAKKTIYKENALKIYNQIDGATISMIKSGYYDNVSEDYLNNFSISPYSHPMSFVYLSIHVKEVLGEKYIHWSTIDLIFDQIKLILPQVKNCDYLLGLSGLVDFLLNMKKEITIENLITKIDDIVRICLIIISEEAHVKSDYASWVFYDAGTEDKNKLGGFSHGTAGISYVLFKSMFFIEDENIKSIANQALNFDRSFYDEKINGWLDRRDLGETFDSTAWCHGSGGVGLGRLLTKQFYNDDILSKEINIAKNNLVKNGFLGNQCICHGDFGNLEILKGLSNKHENDSFIWDYLDKLCDDFSLNKKLNCGDGGQMELLGLFMGYSGFGYQMLRFYDWKNTPSVLCLETPNTLNYELHEK